MFVSPEMEKRIVRAVEEAISMTNNGCSPNDAIYKVASVQQFEPPVVARIVEAFNKSKSVFMLKHAADKTKPFELANTQDILGRIYRPVEKAAAAEPDRLPDFDFSLLGVMPEMEKTARQAETIPVHSAAIRFEKFAGFCHKVLYELHNRKIQKRHAFNEALKEAAEQLRELPDPVFAKIAQNVVNAYPKTGPLLMELLAINTRKPWAPMQKTANTAIFLAKEPYLSISRLYDTARAYNVAKSTELALQKQAEEGGNSFKAFLGGLAGAGMGSKVDEGGDKGKSNPLDQVSPATFNKLKELEARQSLMNLMIFDDDLKPYPWPKLVTAYNEAVSVVPDAYKRPTVLKNMMLQHLASGGIKDPATMRAEVAMGRDIAMADKAKEM